ncbi:FAS1 domain-containing protein, partial [Tricladium varicosporioides]
LLQTQPALLNSLSNATNITILAPSNDALTAFLQSSAGVVAANNSALVAALLQYHILQGTYYNFTTRPQFVPTLLNSATYANVTGGQRIEAIRNGTNTTIYSGFVERSAVQGVPVNFTGGTVHVINKVLTIPQSDSTTLAAANLTSLSGALSQLNLVNAINSLRDVTIFAPSNVAFSRISSALSNASTTDLTNVLSYHVVNGTVGYSSRLTNTTLRTFGGQNLTIRIQNGSIFVNSARVTTPDVLVANGVVHIIDAVLNPNASTATPEASGTSTSAVFPGATSASEAPYTSGVTQTATITNAPIGAGGAVTTSSSAGAMKAIQTGMVGAMGMGALFGAGAYLL